MLYKHVLINNGIRCTQILNFGGQCECICTLHVNCNHRPTHRFLPLSWDLVDTSGSYFRRCNLYRAAYHLPIVFMNSMVDGLPICPKPSTVFAARVRSEYTVHCDTQWAFFGFLCNSIHKIILGNGWIYMTFWKYIYSIYYIDIEVKINSVNAFTRGVAGQIRKLNLRVIITQLQAPMPRWPISAWWALP